MVRRKTVFVFNFLLPNGLWKVIVLAIPQKFVARGCVWVWRRNEFSFIVL
jgi:hypothetical protein